jgi:chloramphenicol-sensitive protein RarD
VLLGVLAYLIWGFLPLYLRPLATHDPPFSAILILAHRVVWSVFLLAGLLTVMRMWGEVLAAVRSRRTLGMLAITTALVCVNWYTFTYVATTGQVIQSALGYFITPIVSAVLGMVFLKERLRPMQCAAFVLAACGVAYLGVRLGVVPTTALVLAISWGLYGLVRKIAPVEAVAGLAVETAFLFVPASVFLLVAVANDAPAARVSLPWMLYVMIGCAVLTTVPLICFSKSARILRLSTVGFLQYIGPTCQFLLAVLVFGEPFTRAHAVAFGLIWLALAVFIADAVRANYTARAAPPVPAQEPA